MLSVDNVQARQKYVPLPNDLARFEGLLRQAYGQIGGQIFVFFTITVAAAEVAIRLAFTVHKTVQLNQSTAMRYLSENSVVFTELAQRVAMVA